MSWSTYTGGGKTGHSDLIAKDRLNEKGELEILGKRLGLKALVAICSGLAELPKLS